MTAADRLSLPRTTAKDRHEQMPDSGGRFVYQNVAGGTPTASGKCWMSTARQAADWISTVLYESRVRRSQSRPPKAADAAPRTR